MTMKAFAHGNARSVQEAVAALGDASRPLAGGTDLVAMMKDSLVAPERLVNLKTIPELSGIVQEADAEMAPGWYLGALLTLADLANSDLLRTDLGVACLQEAAGQSASPQLRHMATLGGNLVQRPRCWYFRNPKIPCWRKGGQRCYAIVGKNEYHTILGRSPCVAVHPSDPAVALLALGALVVIEGAAGRRQVGLADLYRAPSRDRTMADGYRPVTEVGESEIITGIIVPAQASSTRSAYVKKMERGAWDFALVSAAAVIARSDDGSVQQARLALGGVANIPWLVSDCEQVLVGKALTEEVILAAAECALEGARALEHNAYKLALARGAVREALRSLVG